MSVPRLFFASIFLLSLVARAQTITATLSGVVADPAGSAIPNATVQIVSVETGIKKTGKTDAEGRYNIPFLGAGMYNVTAEANGFQSAQQTGLRLEVAQSAGLDFKLVVAGVNQSIEVKSEALPLLNTENGGLENTIESKLIMDIPSGERSTLALLNALPGVVDVGFSLGQGEAQNTNGNAQGPIGSPGNRNYFDANFGVSGGQTASNDVLLDGVSDTIGDFNGIAVSPPQDSVQEFKVMSGVFSAEYGRTGGGVVNFVTKAGGQKFHGSLYEYFQNGALNANGWQRNRAGVGPDGVTPRLPRIPLKRSQFGGAVGGPVGVGKHKMKDTFFFFNYEGRREKNPFSQTLTVPTAKMRTGDLSELLVNVVRAGVPLNSDGSAPLFGQQYDPYAALERNPSGTLVRPVIPGNRMDRLPKCPSSGPRLVACLDPIALAVMQFVPLPNQPGLTDNYNFSGTTPFERNLIATRIDKTLSERHSLFGRFSYEKRHQEDPSFLDSVATNGRAVRDTFFNTTFNDVYTLTPWAITNFRYGYTRAHAHQITIGEAANFDPVTLGFPKYLHSQSAVGGFPQFLFSSAGPQTQGLAGEITTSTVGASGGNDQPRDTQTLANTVTMFRGAHTLKVGAEYRLLRFFANQNTNPLGSFTFNRNFTRGPVAATTPANATETGSSLSSLLLGIPGAASIQAVTPITLYHHYAAGYVQDDWRVNRRLTVNIGLRWDLETGTGESHDQLDSFDLNASSPLNGKVGAPTDPSVLALNPSFTNLRGLLSFPHGPQSGSNYNRFAPRAGFAYRLNDNTVVRGGYGISYVPQSVEQSTAIGVNFTTSPAQTSQTGQVVQPGGTGSPTYFLNDPFPTGIPSPPGNSQGALTMIGRSPTVAASERPTAYMQMWNFSIQRLLPGRIMLDLTYVGSHGIRLPLASMNLNEIPPSMVDYARANFRQARDVNGAAPASVTEFFTQQVQNPFFGVITDTGSVLSTRTVQRQYLLRPYPQYDNPSLYRPLAGQSKYTAGQLSVRKTYARGLSLMSSFAWSRAFDLGGTGNNASAGGSALQDIYNLKAGYGLSAFDVPFRFTALFSYDLPFAKKSGRLVKALAGGWQVSGNTLWQSGTPLVITAPTFLNYATVRADRNSSIAAQFPVSQLQQNIRNDTFAFNVDAFTQPATLFFGTAARTYNDVRRDNYKNVSLSSLKNVSFHDGKIKAQLRGEYLNVFNMVVFGTPGTDVSNRDLVQNGTLIRKGTFGRVTGQGNLPRTIQLVLRVTF